MTANRAKESLVEPVSPHLSPDDLAGHAYAVAVSGCTMLPAQVSATAIDELGRAAERAMAAARAARRAGQTLKYTVVDDYYDAVRCLYCWGDACVRLLEHEALHALATALMGQYHLWDMELLSALPLPPDVAESPIGWHRDFGAGSERPEHLWCFVCLDDITSENGATWVVPGSHRLSAVAPPQGLENIEAYPVRLQLRGRAGDILVMNPSMLHAVGRNRTARPRRLLLVALGAAQTVPLLNHWAVAGPSIQEGASARVRMMLQADRLPLDTTWTVLPEGWRRVGRSAQEATP